MLKKITRLKNKTLIFTSVLALTAFSQSYGMSQAQSKSKTARKIDFSRSVAERNQLFTPPAEQEIKKVAHLFNTIKELQENIILKQKTIAADQQQLNQVIRHQKMLKAFFRKRHFETRFVGKRLRAPSSLATFDVAQARATLKQLNRYADRAERKLRSNELRLRRIPLEAAAWKDAKRKLIPQLKQLTLATNFNDPKISLAIGSTLQTLLKINQNERFMLRKSRAQQGKLNLRCLEKLH